MIKTLKNNFYLLKYVFKYATDYAVLTIISAVLVAADNVVMAGVLPRLLYDSLSRRAPLGEILAMLAALGLLIVVRYAVRSFNEEYMRPRASVRVASRLQSELYERAVALDLAKYDDPDFYDSFVFAMSEADTRAMETFSTFERLFACLLIIGGFAGVIASADPAAFLFAAMYFAVNFWIQTKRVRTELSRAELAKPDERRRDYALRVFTEPRYARELRATGVAAPVYTGLKAALGRLRDTYVSTGKKLFTLHMAEAFFAETLFLNAGLYGYLAWSLIGAHSITVGEMLALASSSEQIIWRTGDVVYIIRGLAENGLFAEKMRAFFAQKSAITGEKIPPEAGDIAFDNVWFAYPGREPVLRGVTFSVKRGERLAIVGANGEGKSTIVKLLLRLYEPSSGRILCGGQDIRWLEPRKYRERFGAAFQDAAIFAATLAENVALREVGAGDRERVTAALLRAGFGDRLGTLPSGLDTELSKEFDAAGVELSGGERQKVATSRAFCSDAEIKILDEPSAALDPISEYELNRVIRDSEAGKTVIFISHRLSTCVVADRIIVLDGGRVAESGTHDELLAIGGVYAEMWRAQIKNVERFS